MKKLLLLAGAAALIYSALPRGAEAQAVPMGAAVNAGGTCPSGVTAVQGLGRYLYATNGGSLCVAGTINVGPVPATSTPETASSGNVAAAVATATLATAVGRTTYITGFECTASGSTAALPVNLTVTGIITGTQTFTFVFPAGVLIAATPVSYTYSTPMPASATNTTIVVSLPSGGAGNTNAACTATGFQF